MQKAMSITTHNAQLMEAIHGFVVSDLKTVSYSWLTHELGISANEAKKVRESRNVTGTRELVFLCEEKLLYCVSAHQLSLPLISLLLKKTKNDTCSHALLCVDAGSRCVRFLIFERKMWIECDMVAFRYGSCWWKSRNAHSSRR